jgi:hypothetical protein
MANKRPITTPSSLAELPDTDALIVGQGPVLAEQASSLGTPASGYGVIYAKTDGKVYFKNDAGTETDLTATGGGGTDPVVREYTSNDTWTVPTASNFFGALLIAYGAGGGGGSGRRGATNVTTTGGTGGGGGALAMQFIRAADFASASYSITIGAGGTGGASQTVNSTDGNNGTAGGDVTVIGTATILRAKSGSGGLGGRAGTASGGAGGSIGTSYPNYGPFALGGGNGGLSSAVTGGGLGNRGLDQFAGTGGSGGGGFNSSNTRLTPANGQFVRVFSSSVAGATADTSEGGNGPNGTDNGNKYLTLDQANQTTYGIGSGGAGGASGNAAGTIAGGNGGNGGNYAVGGSGGGASRNGANSGAGGLGSGGLLIIVEYFGA